MTLHFLNDISNDADSTKIIDHYVIFASLKIGNREYQFCQAWLRERMLNRSASLAMSTSILKACLVNLISKDAHLIFSISYLQKQAL